MKTKSKKQELRWAKSLDGKAIPGSGNQPSWKGDVDSGLNSPDFLDDWKLECKTTKRPFYTLHIKDLTKLEGQAKKVSRLPAFVIEFLDACLYNGNEYVIIREQDFNNERFPHLLDNESTIYQIKSKNIKFTVEELDNYWLNDKKIELLYKDNLYIILNKLDFLKMIRRI